LQLGSHQILDRTSRRRICVYTRDIVEMGAFFCSAIAQDSTPSSCACCQSDPGMLVRSLETLHLEELGTLLFFRPWFWAPIGADKNWISNLTTEAHSAALFRSRAGEPTCCRATSWPCPSHREIHMRHRCSLHWSVVCQR